MKVGDIQSLIESWAPREIAWERDNVGLQCGDPGAEVHRILVALDVTEAVIAEARRRNADLLISHHPLLFRPVQSVHPGTLAGRCLKALLVSDIALLSAHTNMDFARGGTSFALAEILGLEQVSFLHRPYRTQKKIVTFVPASHLETVASAMAEAGAGVIGNYEHCSFRTPGSGTFRGNASSNPAVGQSGTLPRAVPPAAFLRTIKRVLGTGMVRCTPFHTDRVQRVAACGGSGADLLGEAVRQGADLFITADVKYHAFHDAVGETILVDAGHWETEFPVVRVIAARLDKELRRRSRRLPVMVASTPTNPVRYV
jgi:dinuclear metal center YbgI/SA1388 family protein